MRSSWQSQTGRARSGTRSRADAELMAVGDGWPERFDALYRSEYPSLVRLAALLTGSGAIAEEIVQDAFVRSRSALDGAERPAAYLRTAVVNGCRTMHRRRALALRRVPRAAGLAEAAEPELHELADVLGLLPERQRAVLILRYYADLSEAEIADVLGCRPGTVKSLAHRGLERLRTLIQP
jgi:RNA polymerase sigma-70 factor (sigma-E family)